MPLSPFALRNSTASMSRSAFAVVMGYLTTVVLIVGSFTLLALLQPDLLLMPEPSRVLLFITLACSWLAALPAGYITAALATEREYMHASVLIVALIVLDWVSMYLEAGAKPLWWHVSLQIGAIVFVLLGVTLRMRAKLQMKWWQFWR